MKKHTEVVAGQFKSKKKILLKYWRSTLKRNLLMTSFNESILSFYTKADVMKKLNEIKSEQIFGDNEPEVNDLTQPSYIITDDLQNEDILDLTICIKTAYV